MKKERARGKKRARDKETDRQRKSERVRRKNEELQTEQIEKTREKEKGSFIWPRYDCPTMLLLPRIFYKLIQDGNRTVILVHGNSSKREA